MHTAERGGVRAWHGSHAWTQVLEYASRHTAPPFMWLDLPSSTPKAGCLILSSSVHDDRHKPPDLVFDFPPEVGLCGLQDFLISPETSLVIRSSLSLIASHGLPTCSWRPPGGEICPVQACFAWYVAVHDIRNLGFSLTGGLVLKVNLQLARCDRTLCPAASSVRR